MQEFEISNVALFDLDGVAFSALFSGKIYKFLISREALEDLQGAISLDGSGLLSAFENRRALIIRVAQKFTDPSYEHFDRIILRTENFR